MACTPTSNVLCAFQLGPDEVKDYTLDVSSEVADDTGTVVDPINTVVWSADPDGELTLANQFVSTDGKSIGIWASTPKPGQAYRVKAHCTTSGAKEFDVVIAIAGICK